MNRHHGPWAAVLAAAVVLGGCQAEPVSRAADPDPVEPSATSTDVFGPFPAASGPAFAEDEPGRGRSRATALEVGSATRVGDWLVRVAGYDRDATTTILDHDERSQPPPEGSSYALARLEATWGGEGRSNAFIELEWAVVDEVGNEYTDVGCPVLPEDLANQDSVGSGQTAIGTICFVVPDRLQTDLTLFVAPLLGEPGTRRWWSAPATGAGELPQSGSDASDTP